MFHSDTNLKDNTFKREIGQKEPKKDYYTTYSDYGQNNDEILPYTHEKLNTQDDMKK